MAKINDLKRAIALDVCREVYDKHDHYLPIFDARALSSLSIKFGKENRHGVGLVKVSFDVYFKRMYKYTFDGWFDHAEMNVTLKTLTIEPAFWTAHLYSINNNKFEGLWLEEEDVQEGVVPVTASVEAVEDGNTPKPII